MSPMPALKLGHIELFVKDPSRSKQFYRDVLLFDVTDEQGENHIWLRSGGIEILLRRARQAPTAQTYQDATVALVMYTDDLPATLARFKKHGVSPRRRGGISEVPDIHRSGWALDSGGESKGFLRVVTDHAIRTRNPARARRPSIRRGRHQQHLR